MKRFVIALSIVGLGFAGAAVASPVKDGWLTSKTKMRLMADKRVKASAVTVETDDAVVTLRGKVTSNEERMAAEQIARDTDGVRSVSNALQVVPQDQRRVVDARDEDIKQSVKNRMETDQSLRDSDISVRSDNAMVTLMGTVDDARAKNRAVELARAVSGVKSVRNELKSKDTRAAAAPR